MSKINFDKYYTDPKIVDHCIRVAFDVIGRDSITHIVEPSAGNGAFSLKLDCDAYDLEPEHESITKQDFLELQLDYKQGRLIIGNPPFGRVGILANKFYKHSVHMGDYVAMILPASRYRNNRTVYEMDLIHTELLPPIEYSGRKLSCCFNVFKRPISGVLNKPPKKASLEDVEISEHRRGGKEISDDVFSAADISVCTWGSESTGKELSHNGQYARSASVRVRERDIAPLVVDTIRKADWHTEYPYSTTNPGKCGNLTKWMIVDYLKREIPGIR